MTNKTILEAPEESLEQIAIRLGATHYSPPPMRAVRGLSFTFDQLGAFVDELASSQAAAEQPTKEAAQPVGEHFEISDEEIIHIAEKAGMWAVTGVYSDNTKFVTKTGGDVINVVRAVLQARSRQPAQAAEQPEKEGDVAHEVGAGPLVVNIGALEKAVNEYVENYEMTDGEVSHMPDENERALILDAIHGLLVDEAFDAAFGPVSAHHPDSGEWQKIETAPKDALSALDAQGGEAVAWRFFTGTPNGRSWTALFSSKSDADAYALEHLIAGTYEIQPLYTHPSPAAVQALREALAKARSLYNLGYNVRNAEEYGEKPDPSGVMTFQYQDAANALLTRIEAILKERP